jgi:hypothetical protein
METAQTTLLESVTRLRDLLEQDQEPFEKIDLTLLTLLDMFVEDQHYELGQKRCPYYDDLQRRVYLRQILHSTDKVLDAMNEFCDGEPLPPAAQVLCRLLFEITFSTFLTVQRIERQHPELAEMFEAERAAYNATRIAQI